MYVYIYFKSLTVTNFSGDLYDGTEPRLAESAVCFSISPFKVSYSLPSSLFRAAGMEEGGSEFKTVKLSLLVFTSSPTSSELALTF